MSAGADDGVWHVTGPGHDPVLLGRVLDLLTPVLEAEEGVFVDATLGLGGHTEAVLTRFPRVEVIGLDRDPAALAHARTTLAAFRHRLTCVESRYDRLQDVLAQAGHACVQAVLFDLGVSSMQLDEPERGFSYAHDAPLDMRMGAQDRLTAADVVNTYEAGDLARVLRAYAEERFARRIADAIVAARANRPLRTTAQLVEVIRIAIPAAARRTGGNPAKRTFQALRIEVNDELSMLRDALPAALESVCVGGRVVALAYHSLEDRIVKRSFVEAATADVPPDLPVLPDELRPRFQLVTRGAERASDAEIARNRRARPVRLRAVERTGVAA